MGKCTKDKKAEGEGEVGNGDGKKGWRGERWEMEREGKENVKGNRKWRGKERGEREEM